MYFCTKNTLLVAKNFLFRFTFSSTFFYITFSFFSFQGLGYNEIKDSLPEGIEVACHNSAISCTLSGPAEKVEEFTKQLTSKKIFNKNVNVANIAFHSTYIESLGPVLHSKLKKVLIV